MTELRMEVAKRKLLKEFIGKYDVLDALKVEAKDRDTTWQKLLKDYPDFEHRSFGNLDTAWEQFRLFRSAYENDKELKKRAA